MKYISIKEAYGDDAILKEFPLPDYSHISPNIDIAPAIWIAFSKIYISDEPGNVARADGQDPVHVADLVSSFSLGVMTNQELGAVSYRGIDPSTGKEYDKPYELKYGYGRTLSQIELGAKGWAFNVIEGTETEIEDVCSFENEDPIVKLVNKEIDIIRLKSKQVAKGTLANNEEAILANLKKTYPRRKKASIHRIASGIFESNATPLKYAYYTEAKIKLWRENHYSGWFEIAGNWDKERQMFGYTSKIGGLYRSFYRALNKYADNKMTSYVNAYVGNVMKGSTLEQQKVSVVNEYITLRVNHAIAYGKDVKFLTLNGFFPQSYGKENWSDFILLDQEALELKVALSIKAKKKLLTLQSAA